MPPAGDPSRKKTEYRTAVSPCVLLSSHNPYGLWNGFLWQWWDERGLEMPDGLQERLLKGSSVRVTFPGSRTDPDLKMAEIAVVILALDHHFVVTGARQKQKTLFASDPLFDKSLNEAKQSLVGPDTDELDLVFVFYNGYSFLLLSGYADNRSVISASISGSHSENLSSSFSSLQLTQ